VFVPPNFFRSSLIMAVKVITLNVIAFFKFSIRHLQKKPIHARIILKNKVKIKLLKEGACMFNRQVLIFKSYA
jgi:hypothetical protein